MQTFYHGLISSTRESIDAVARELSCHLSSRTLKQLLRRWRQIQHGMKNVLSLGRKEEESII